MPESNQDPAELFEAALDLDPRERAEFLNKACAGNAALRGEVDSLLAADEEATEFLRSPLRDVATQHARPEVAVSYVGKQLGGHSSSHCYVAAGAQHVNHNWFRRTAE